MKSFYQWVEEKKKMFKEQIKYSYDSEVLIDRFDTAITIFKIYENEMEKLKGPTPQEMADKAYQDQLKMVALNGEICKIGVCIHPEHWKPLLGE